MSKLSPDEFPPLSEHHPAFRELKYLGGAGIVTENKKQELQSKFTKAYEVLLRMMENDSTLFKKAQALSQNNDGIRRENEEHILELRKKGAELEELKKTQAKLIQKRGELEEANATFIFRMRELQQTANLKKQEYDTAQRIMDEQFQPLTIRLQREIEDITADVAKNHEAITKQREDNAAKKQQLEDLAARKQLLSLDEVKLKAQELKMRMEPSEKLTDAVDAALHSVLSQCRETDEQIIAKTNELGTLDKRIQQVNADIAAQEDQIKDFKRKDDEKKAEIDRITHSIENAKDEIFRKGTELDRIDNLLRNQKAQHQTAQNFLMQKASELKKQQVLHQNAIKERDKVQSQLPGMRNQASSLAHEISRLEQEVRGMDVVRQEKEHDVDIFMAKDLEGTMEQLAHSASAAQHRMMFLRQARELAGRQAAQKRTDAARAQELVKIKEVNLNYLAKKLECIGQSLQYYHRQYELYKQQRNKYMAQIQDAVQLLAEGREKIKVSENELDILRNEDLQKQKALMDTKLTLQSFTNQRDAERRRHNRDTARLREIKVVLSQQIAEQDKLNAHINAIEQRMIELKKEYEYQVEQRNFTGIQLIQRNDELCFHYEQLNIQDAVSARGQQELQRRDEELRVLRLEVAERARRAQNLQKQVEPMEDSLAKYEEEMAQLREAKDRVRSLTEQLEKPDNATRWKLLGVDEAMQEAGATLAAQIESLHFPQPADLQARISELEERLNAKKEQLLEKELVMDEVTAMSDQIRKDAIGNMTQSLGTATKVNEQSHTLTALSRRLKATVSELSVFQANAMQLQQEKAELEQIVADARAAGARRAPDGRVRTQSARPRRAARPRYPVPYSAQFPSSAHRARLHHALHQAPERKPLVL
ncbi:putative coiled-coil flagellar protein; move backward only 2 [Paratrimastix pyriformis]|uniref:Coiled-coil flagellar protein n=1 Tax=Paratrimastix pyriformis TaxID=342808 RepID=A0ABQ8UIR1_9EUKA|nr:putative coiled-coil flagellar protein; move backward only 2 [Paratrimastix pyriformis]